ncbi:hypothetical protein P3H15_52970 [Rhodococcus sp. T2V]|uniref:hypothetical protein n=1 Tax=Rhodococcus sp. T2V TaxID=3034164 RepID=UPI0023E1E541|nr:hypothetical protein [Rhodococcus sp. T2V]MDF3313608.1 hypothetical protein [Rhodococcus sp. T2V]
MVTSSNLGAPIGASAVRLAYPDEESTDEISGDLGDELIRDRQLDQHHVDEPTDPFSHYRRRRLSWNL